MTESETKEFELGAVLSITTGKLLCQFGDFHECAEWVVGGPIWTHHFASKKLTAAMRDAVIAQHPDLPTALPDCTTENWQEKLTALRAKLGDTRALTKGGGHRAMHPLDGIPAGKPVVVVSP